MGVKTYTLENKETALVNPTSKEYFVGVICNNAGLIIAYLTNDSSGEMASESPIKKISLDKELTVYALKCDEPEKFEHMERDFKVSEKTHQDLQDAYGGKEAIKHMDKEVMQAMRIKAKYYSTLRSMDSPN